MCTINHLKATDQLIQELTSAAIKEVDISREIASNCKNERLKKMYQPFNTVDIPLNYSRLFRSS